MELLLLCMLGGRARRKREPQLRAAAAHVTTGFERPPVRSISATRPHPPYETWCLAGTGFHPKPHPSCSGPEWPGVTQSSLGHAASWSPSNEGRNIEAGSVRMMYGS